jgi:photosynthetic reaction center cytochrome c subunit
MIGLNTSRVAVATLLVAGGLLAGCERPPVETQQIGYRGVAMGTVSNPRLTAEIQAANRLPEVVPAVPAGGPLAGTVYKNVQVLDDLTVAEFSRVMVAITQWVAPADQSCAFCHGGSDLAADDTYTKVVSRRMLEMVRDINENKRDHVGATGVTCYTCHRGQAVPANIWFKDPGPAHASMMAGNLAGQNAPSPVVGLASLPNDPFTPFLMGDSNIRVVSTAALPVSAATPNIKDTEATYGLMMHMSGALGVNCTFCHNSRSFAEWDGSTPQRAVAWHGINTVRTLNRDYMEPLTGQFPKERLGPLGDVPKINCATCHQGVSKPMLGQSMLKDYPELAARRPPPPAPEPEVAAADAAPAPAN